MRARQAKWDHRWMDIARAAASWSKDLSTKVGAVVTQRNRIVSLGYNGFVEAHADAAEHYADREYKNKNIVHAEANALVQAAARLPGLALCCLYVTFPPCTTCYSKTTFYGIRRIVTLTPVWEGRAPEWVEYWQRSVELFKISAATDRVEVVWL